MPLHAMTTRDDGSVADPTVEGWDEWVSASSTRSYALGDPIIDWLRMHGEALGYAKDTDAPGYDPRMDFTEFIFGQGARFEQAVLGHISARVPIVTIAAGYEDIRSAAKAEATFAAMAAGAPAIYQGVLWDAEHRVYGAPDLLVRADVLESLFPGTIPPAAMLTAPDLGGIHYRVLDIKFTTIRLLKDGSLANGSSAPAYKVQLFLYNRALGRLQGYEPPEAYLLGRSWEQAKERGTSAIERLGPVPMSGTVANKRAISDVATGAVHWVRRVRREGASWAVLPEPSVPELYPNSTNQQDSPWSKAKREISRQLEDVTLLWKVGLGGRESAHTLGIRRWTDPACTPEAVGVTGPNQAPILQALLDINRSVDGPPILPARIQAAEEEWRATPPLEFYVDFETFSDLADDFATFPVRGGQPLIFMIGCGHIEDGQWQFTCFVADDATEASEARVIERWFAHMESVRARLAPDAPMPLVIHWSPAEVSNFETAYNSAIARHGRPEWPTPNWFDFLRQVMHREPVVVRGAMAFGLKSIAKAMHGHGMIETLWDDGPADGLGAMMASWWCYDEAKRTGASIMDIPVMREVIAYNEVDCRVMWEVVSYLRQAH